MRKIIQIAWRENQLSRVDQNTGELKPFSSSTALYALCDDGSIWILDYNPQNINTPKGAYGWVRCKLFPPIPQDSDDKSDLS